MSPPAGLPMKSRLRLDTLHEYVDVGDCWEWNGHRQYQGYGIYSDRKAHRLVYEMLVGPIPAGLVIDHLCRNRACVNPDHLQPVTPLENTRRGIYGNQTHCKGGHRYTPSNTGSSNHGTRYCKTCQIEKRRAA